MTRHRATVLSRRIGRQPRGALTAAWVLIALVIVLGVRTVHACVGSGCMQIWSTADGGGALTVQWDFSQQIQTFESFCTSDRSSCLYTTIDPGFMAPTDAVAGSGYYRLVDGTKVTVEIISADPGLSMNVNGRKLYQPHDSALLGTMPTIHTHPSWQVVVPGDQLTDFRISYHLKSDSPTYADSEVFTAVVTNIEPTPAGSPTPTPTPLPAQPPCVGDCDATGSVTVNEIIAAVNMALNGCPMPTPVSFAEIQQMIFTPRCATTGCHSGPIPTGNLSLVDGESYAQLVNVAPSVELAAQAGQLRVDPGHPENSFLLVKIVGQPPGGEGSPMPLTGDPLTAEQIQMVRDWILEGAQP